MSEEELIDSHVSLHQCQLAVETLYKHESKAEDKRQEYELISRREPFFWLILAVKQIHPTKSAMPIRIPIIHPLVDPRTTPICLITKDPQREYKDLLEANKIKFISRVVGVEKLKGKFRPFEARRALLKEYGMFLADERVIPLLPKLLGVKFFKSKKQPVPVCLTRKDLKGELERAISATYMHQTLGTCAAVKIGVLSHTPSKIVANLKSALPAIVSRIKGGWSNVQSFQIKTDFSVSLPIWNCALDDSEHGRWGGLGATNPVVDEFEDDSGTDISEEIAEEPTPPSVKSKKQPAGTDDTVATKSQGAKKDSAKRSKLDAKSPDEIPSAKASKPKPKRGRDIESMKEVDPRVEVGGPAEKTKKQKSRRNILVEHEPKPSKDQPTADTLPASRHDTAAPDVSHTKAKKRKGSPVEEEPTATAKKRMSSQGPDLSSSKKRRKSKNETTTPIDVPNPTSPSKVVSKAPENAPGQPASEAGRSGNPLLAKQERLLAAASQLEKSAGNSGGVTQALVEKPRKSKTKKAKAVEPSPTVATHAADYTPIVDGPRAYSPSVVVGPSAAEPEAEGDDALSVEQPNKREKKRKTTESEKKKHKVVDAKRKLALSAKDAVLRKKAGSGVF